MLDDCAAVIPVRCQGHTFTVSLRGDRFMPWNAPLRSAFLGALGLHLPGSGCVSKHHTLQILLPCQDRTARVLDVNGATWQLTEVSSGQVGPLTPHPSTCTPSVRVMGGTLTVHSMPAWPAQTQRQAAPPLCSSGKSDGQLGRIQILRRPGRSSAGAGTCVQRDAARGRFGGVDALVHE